MWPWELAGVAYQGSCLVLHLLIRRARRPRVQQPTKVATMDHMRRTFFCFIFESNAVIVIISSILLAILVTRFEIVELDGSLYSSFRRGDI